MLICVVLPISVRLIVVHALTPQPSQPCAMFLPVRALLIGAKFMGRRINFDSLSPGFDSFGLTCVQVHYEVPLTELGNFWRPPARLMVRYGTTFPVHVCRPWHRLPHLLQSSPLICCPILTSRRVWRVPSSLRSAASRACVSGWVFNQHHVLSVQAGPARGQRVALHTSGRRV